jgi:hypothetical protein
MVGWRVPTNPPLTTRVDPSIVDRVDRLSAAMNAAKEPGAKPFDRGGTVRMLVLHALPVLERAYGIRAPSEPRPKVTAGRKAAAPGRARARNAVSKKRTRSQ